MSFPLLRTQRTASQASCTAAGKGFSGASLHNSQFHDRYQVVVVCLPIIYCYHNTFPSCAEVRGDDVLRVDCTEDPAAAMEIDAGWPAAVRYFAGGGEASNPDIGPLTLSPWEGVVRSITYGMQRSGPGDEDAARTGCLDGLQMNLLLIEDVLVVESSILRIYSVYDRIVERIWRQRHCVSRPLLDSFNVLILMMMIRRRRMPRWKNPYWVSLSRACLPLLPLTKLGFSG